MKEQITIPTSKVQRASKFISTGAKVGGNYLKHYSKRLFDSEHTRDELDTENADDIYASLSELKGSALKVAQMMSMDKNILPTAYQNKFAQSQYSAPPLSFPLVVKTFKKAFNKSPNDIFDTFSKNAINAASIGQVHQATLNGKKLAVKVQYPGVASSITSDLKMLRPIASRLFNVGPAELREILDEVEQKLIEETNYELELKRSMALTTQSGHLENVVFPNYYPELSSDKILAMDWLEGMHLEDWLKTNPTQEKNTLIGQTLWNFYHYQMHELKEVHADPHPGNFIITAEGKLGIIDFGCVKVIPSDFYDQYFKLMHSDVLSDQFDLETLFMQLGFISDKDTPQEKSFFLNLFKQMIELLGRPFRNETFDFGNDAYFAEIFEIGERMSKMKELRKSKSARGNRHAIYINRTYFGLYNLLNKLNANISTGY